MTVLDLDGDGYLPSTQLPRVVSLDDIYDTFVDSAPHAAARDRLYRAMRLNLELLHEIFGQARVWIGGTFVSLAPHEPRQVEMVYVCRDVPHYLRNLKLAQFERALTLSSVVIGYPRLLGTGELKPVGGLVNTVQVRPEHLPLEYERLSQVCNAEGQPVEGGRVGFVEVTL